MVDDTPITAYHGTPHDFEQFDTSKIGTGEGTQLYGHGLYFAEHEPVAKWYRDQLSHTNNDLPKKGHMYEVAIHAHPDHFINYNKALGDQHPFVKERIRNALTKKYNSKQIADETMNSDADFKDILDNFDDMESHEISKMFHNEGIQGIKYLDANSRVASDQPTHNYVVFDHNRVKVKRKYEQGGRVAYKKGGKVEGSIWHEDDIDTSYLGNLLRGLQSIPETAYNYLTKTSYDQMGSDAVNLAKNVYHDVTEHPVENLLGALPIVGSGMSAYDAYKLNDRIKHEYESGNYENAQKLERALVLSSLGAIPIFGELSSVGSSAARMAEEAALHGAAETGSRAIANSMPRDAYHVAENIALNKVNQALDSAKKHMFSAISDERITTPNIGGDRSGDVEGYGRGGSPEDDIIRQRLAAIPSIEHEDPAMREKAFGIAQKTHAITPDYDANLGQSFYGFKTPISPENVQATVNPIPGVNPLNPQKQTYKQFYKTAKGGTLVNLGGDRSRLGRLTHIHGQELAWPVDLHAGPQYMLEPNKGAVWANAAGQTTRNKRLIESLQKKGPVYGLYSPMGPKSVDSSFQMSDALMSQLAKQKPEPEMVKKFDKELRAGLFEEPAKRDKAIEKMKEWPGLDDPWAARNFLKTLPGTTRSLIVKHMDKSGYHKAGFPHVGMTRVALTDPELLKTGGNMIGHRVVELTPESIEASAFEHNTYPEITSGRYVADVPLVQRHYALPQAVQQFAEEPHKPGILHPYSENPNARSGFKKMTEEQKMLQNIDEPWLESVQRGLANQKKYGFKKGGIAKTTQTIHNSPIVEHALGKVSAALPALDLPLMAAKAGRRY
jgi:hypothetical protein